MSTQVKPILKLVIRNFFGIVRMVLIAQAVGFFAFSLSVSADDIEDGSVVLSKPCPMASVQSQDCPTCGVTRGVASMGSLEWGRAWEYNPISVFLFTLELLLLVGLLRQTNQKHPVARERLHA